MEAPGLYYPYIHIRDDDWLKGAVLYWPSVRRLSNSQDLWIGVSCGASVAS